MGPSPAVDLNVRIFLLSGPSGLDALHGRVESVSLKERRKRVFLLEEGKGKAMSVEKESISLGRGRPRQEGGGRVDTL